MSDNTVHSEPSLYKITVVTDETNVNVTQGITKVVQVATQGPQGPQGEQGPQGPEGDLTALNNFSASILTFTGSIQTQVNNLTAATSSYLLTATTASMLQPYVLTSVTSSLIVSGALTASYYAEADPIFVAKSASLATTGSNTFYGNQIINGDLTVTGSITALQYIISSSVIYITESNFSGSHIFGNSLDDTHQFTGSVLITGSVNLVGNQTITGSLLLTQSHISTVDYIDYRILTAVQHPTHVEGRTHWLDDTKTLQIDTDVNNFSIEVGHQNVVRARNTTGYDLAAGKIVYINGESGNRPTITTASWDGDPTSAATLGFVAQLIGDNQTGYVVTNGMLRGINTNAFAPGTQLYLSSSGNYTSTIPVSPKHEVRLGKTITQATDGVIYVDIMNGYELGELHDVLFNNSTNGDLVIKSGSLWINSKQLTGSYGLTGSLQATSFTGSLLGTASYITGSIFNSTNPALSASYALTASHALNGGGTANIAISSSGTGLTATVASINFTGAGVTATNAGNNVTVTVPGGGTSAPGGANTTIQFNDSTAFSGSKNFTFDKSTNLVTIQKAGTQYTSPPSIIPNTSSLAINGNISVLGKIQTNEASIFTQTFPQTSILPFGKSFEWDLGKSGSIASITLSDNATDFDINYFGNSLEYAKGILVVQQDSAGGWSFPLPTSTGGGGVVNYVQDGGGGIYTPTSNADAVDILEFVCLNKTLYWSIKYNFT